MNETQRLSLPAQSTDRLARGPIHFTVDDAARVAARFAVPGPVTVSDFVGKGNINQHTFLVHAEREYLLQRINHDVFTRPHDVMAAMLASIRAQRSYLARNPLPPGQEWEVITLIPTDEGMCYLEWSDQQGVTVLRLMEKIPDAHTYKSLNEIADPQARLQVAFQVGRGLAMYGDFTSGMDISGLASPLPGYRDTRLYYQQFFSVLQGHRTLAEAAAYLPSDPALLRSTQRHFLAHLSRKEFRRRKDDPELARFIRLAEENAEFGLTLLRAMDAGTIRTVAIHGDTKLDNFLFSTRTGQVKALIDLDTIMPHTWLADWGDMVRSLVNVAGEKETDLSQVQVDGEVFQAIARGFLEFAREITPAETALMVEAVQIIALELGVRFLTDYLRGDTYFRLGPGDPPELNKTRAMVQLTLFERLKQQEGAMRRCITQLIG